MNALGTLRSFTACDRLMFWKAIDQGARLDRARAVVLATPAHQALVDGAQVDLRGTWDRYYAALPKVRP